jgi:hypothetical protein
MSERNPITVVMQSLGGSSQILSHLFPKREEGELSFAGKFLRYEVAQWLVRKAQIYVRPSRGFLNPKTTLV